MSSAPRLAYPRPSGRNRSEFSAILGVGYLAFPTMISCARMVVSTARRNELTSNWSAPGASTVAPGAAVTNLRRLREARLQAESSRYMYSLHGLEALMRAVPDEVCQSLMVVSYCRPGSPPSPAAPRISRHSLRALTVSTGRPSRTARVDQSRSFSTASMKSSVTRTELFEFWKKIDLYASPSNE